ncbi:MAG: hypothetical protein DMF91_22100, partial [Acidobacteria bacterium]
MTSIDRRDFLKAAAAAYFAAAQTKPPLGPSAPRITDAAYTPIRDYPIQPKRYSDVTITDDFWKPKIAINADVTIPFEVQKLSELERDFGGNVLEAAILSLKTHPDAHLQALVDARVHELKQAPRRGNGGFEVAATYFNTTGNRDLLDNAIEAADALYTNFAAHNPPFSGGERDAINCVQL